MEFNPVSLSSIESKVLVFVQQHVAEINGEPLAEFDVRKNLDTINKFPSMAVAVETIDFSKKTDCTGWSPRLFVYLVFKNVARESQRREGIYPLVEGVIRLLTKQTLGLGIEPLEPVSAPEIQNSRFTERGLIGWQIQFKTGFDVDPFDADAEETAIRLLSTSIRYYMQIVDDREHDASDIVDLED